MEARAQEEPTSAQLYYQYSVASELARIARQLDREANRAQLIREMLDEQPTHRSSFLVKRFDAERWLAGQTISEFRETAEPPLSGADLKASALEISQEKQSEYAALADQIRQLTEEVRRLPADQVASFLHSKKITNDNVIKISVQGEIGGNPPPETMTVDYPSVASLLYHETSTSLVVKCTGTLVASNAILTAAHCGKPDFVYLQHGGLFEVEGVPICHPSYRPSEKDPEPHCGMPKDKWLKKYNHTADLAILKLKRTVEGISWPIINTDDTVYNDFDATIVGFGKKRDLYGTPTGLTGIKIWAPVFVARCPDFAGTLCWSNRPVSYRDMFGMSCNGDSGGPVFASIAGQIRLVGVIASVNHSCWESNSQGRAVNLAWYSAMWLEPSLQRIATSSTLQGLGAPLNATKNDRRFSLEQKWNKIVSGTWDGQFDVIPNTTLLRIGVNTAWNQYNDLQSFSFKAGPVGSSTPLCDQSEKSTTVAACALSNPPAGPWFMRVSGESGQEFQAVATPFLAP